jgi:hypothetical protein
MSAGAAGVASPPPVTPLAKPSAEPETPVCAATRPAEMTVRRQKTSIVLKRKNVVWFELNCRMNVQTKTGRWDDESTSRQVEGYMALKHSGRSPC